MAAPHTPSPCTCPLCGQHNACAVATTGDRTVPCWCRSATFSSALLARVPPAQRGLSCICAQCAHADTAPDTAPDSAKPPA